MAEEILISYRVEVDQLKAELKAVQAQMKATENSGKEAANKTSKEFNKAGSDIKNTLKDIAVSIGVAFGVSQVISFGKESIKAFAEAEVNANKLKFAVTQIGKEGNAAFQKLIDQSEKLQDISIFSDDDIQKAQTQLATLGLNSKQIEELIPKVLDLASATGQELGSATDSIIQGINGQTRGLRAVGLEFDATSDKTKNLAILTENLNKFQGSTAAALETTAGKARRLENAFDNLKESIGEDIVTSGNSILDFFDRVTGATTEQEQKLNKLAQSQKDVINKTLDEEVKKAKSSEEARLKAIKDNEAQIQLVKDIYATQNDLKVKQSLLIELQERTKLAQRLKTINEEGSGLKSEVDKEAAAKALEEAKKRAALALEEEKKLRDLRTAIIEDERKKEKVALSNKLDDDLLLYKGNDELLAQLRENYRIDLVAIDKKYDDKEKADNEALYQDAIKAAEAASAEQVRIYEKDSKKRKELREKEAAAEKELQDNKVAYIRDALSSINEISDNITQKRLDEVSESAKKEQDIIQGQYDRGILSREDYDRRILASKKKEEEEGKKIQLAAFKRNKQLALINAAINTAESISKTLATYGIPAGIPLVAIAAALGALQVATIASQPTPKFAKGVVDLKGKGTKTSDEIPALLSRGESVITADATATDKELFKAFNKGKGQKYIYEVYVAPALKEQLKKHSLSKDSSFAQNIANSMMLNSGKLNDGNILESLKMQRKADKENIKYLAKVISKNNYNARSW